MTRILYVEDNDDNVYMLKMRFELLDGFAQIVLLQLPAEVFRIVVFCKGKHIHRIT